MATTATLENDYLARAEKPVRAPGATLYVRVFRVPVDSLDTLMPAVGDTARDDTSEIVIRAEPSIRRGARVAWLSVTYQKHIAGAAA